MKATRRHRAKEEIVIVMAEEDEPSARALIMGSRKQSRVHAVDQVGRNHASLRSKKGDGPDLGSPLVW